MLREPLYPAQHGLHTEAMVSVEKSNQDLKKILDIQDRIRVGRVSLFQAGVMDLGRHSSDALRQIGSIEACMQPGCWF